ncbi:MAG: T9SS type A sorting domain-containing protein [Candidatus Kapabacteria bacterium]|nr:T9SS type A sorting domain-containing protein [Candidatus Kapabacteria bacterium]
MKIAIIIVGIFILIASSLNSYGNNQTIKMSNYSKSILKTERNVEQTVNHVVYSPKSIVQYDLKSLQKYPNIEKKTHDGRILQTYDAGKNWYEVHQTISENIFVKLYPNPAKNLITIESESHIQDCIIKIRDLTGKVLIDFNQPQLPALVDISGLINGTYFITIQTDVGKTANFNFIKE